ncbi:MAG: CBS domain-containing protein [Bacteroidota bacterium]
MKNVKHILQAKGNNIVSVSPDIKVYDAIHTMGENNVASVLVMEDGELIGILTERDYARKVVLQGKFSATTYVREIMTPHPGLITVTPATSVEECMQMMTENRIRHLPVLDGGKIKGVISIGDVVFAMLNEQKDIIEDMTKYLYATPR